MNKYHDTATIIASRILGITGKTLQSTERFQAWDIVVEGGQKFILDDTQFYLAAAKDVLEGNPLGYILKYPGRQSEYVSKAEFEARYTADL